MCASLALSHSTFIEHIECVRCTPIRADKQSSIAKYRRQHRNTSHWKMEEKRTNLSHLCVRLLRMRLIATFSSFVCNDIFAFQSIGSVGSSSILRFFPYYQLLTFIFSSSSVMSAIIKNDIKLRIQCLLYVHLVSISRIALLYTI